jgi:chemotaxis signal transduction protein
MSARRSGAAPSGRPQELVRCEISGRPYAFDCADVRLIVRSEQMIPASEDDGRVGELRSPDRIPVYSVGALLHPSAATDGGEHVIVTGNRDSRVGWQVDRVLRGTREGGLELLQLPELAGPIARRWFKALVNDPDHEPGLVCSPRGLDPRAPASLGPDLSPRPGVVLTTVGANAGIVAMFSSPALPRCGATRYAISARTILAVAQLLSPRAVPGTPAYVVGLAPWRGLAVPVIDLSGNSVLSSSGRYLVALCGRTSPFPVAIPIDRDVVLHRASDRDTLLDARGADHPAGVHVFEVGGEPVGLVDLATLVGARSGHADQAGCEPSHLAWSLAG